MSFSDIDTPASDEELSGTGSESLDPPEVVDPDIADVVPVDESAPVDEQVAEPVQDRSPVIPRARFDEVNAKLHYERERAEAAERRLAEMEQAPATSAPPVAADIDAMELEFFDAMMEGNKESAVKIRNQINAELSSRAEAVASERFSRQMNERDSLQAMQSAGAKAIAAYPFLDHQSDAANVEAINEVVEWRDFYAAKGLPAHAALEKAVAKVGPTYAVATAPMLVATDGRKQAALSRNAVDAAAQPPANVAGVGNRAAPPKPQAETQGDWEKLTEAERNALLI